MLLYTQFSVLQTPISDEEGTPNAKWGTLVSQCVSLL